MRTTSFESLKDELIGKPGTPSRISYEKEVEEAVRDYHIGEAIRVARQKRHMTQAQLADIIGVNKTQVSRMERGGNPTITLVARAFSALGLAVSLTAGNLKFSL